MEPPSSITVDKSIAGSSSDDPLSCDTATYTFIIIRRTDFESYSEPEDFVYVPDSYDDQYFDSENYS